jgi:hypothetical protein
MDFNALTKSMEGAARKVQELYIGKWIRVAGQIGRVTVPSSSGRIAVRLLQAMPNVGDAYMFFESNGQAG